MLTWIFGLISAYLAIRWGAAYKENENLKKKLSIRKEKLYSNYIDFFIDMLNSEAKREEKLVIEAMRRFNKEMTLVSSNRVLLTYGDLMQSFYQKGSAEKNLKLLGELILEMRKDLGNKDWKDSLYWFDPLRLWITDISKYMPEKYKIERRKYIAPPK